MWAKWGPTSKSLPKESSCFAHAWHFIYSWNPSLARRLTRRPKAPVLWLSKAAGDSVAVFQPPPPSLSPQYKLLSRVLDPHPPWRKLLTDPFPLDPLWKFLDLPLLATTELPTLTHLEWVSHIFAQSHSLTLPFTYLTQNDHISLKLAIISLIFGALLWCHGSYLLCHDTWFSGMDK